MRGHTRMHARRVAPRHRAQVALLALLFASAPLAPAYAWTETEVASASAALRLDEGELHVELQLRVDVHRGWLEALEIAGLDPEVELEGPAVFVDEDGQRFVAEPRMRRGSLELTFPRREAPRRGVYRARVRFRSVAYAEPSPQDEVSGRATLRWTLPGWRAGLNGVEVRFDLPAGSDFAPVSEEAGEDEVGLITREREERDGRALLVASRVHLPRTLPWTIAVEVPRDATRERPPEAAPEASERGDAPGEESATAAGTSAPRGDIDARSDPRSDPRSDDAVAEPSSPTSLPHEGALHAGSIAGLTPLLDEDQARWLPSALALVAALLALWALLAFRGHAERRHSTPRPLLPLPFALRLALLLPVTLAGVFGPALTPRVPWAVLAALTLTLLAAQRNAEASVPRFGVWQPISPATRVPRARLPEVGSALGFVLASLLLGVAVLALAGLIPSVGYGVECAAAAAALPLLLGLRHRLPLSPEGRLRLLTGWATGLRVELPAEGTEDEIEATPLAFQLAAHRDEEGALQDARLRVILAERPRGLVRLDLAVAETEAPGGLVPVVRGVVVTREQSPAEELLRELLAGEELRPLRDTSGRFARIVSAERLLQIAAQLHEPRRATLRARETPRRSTTTPLRRPLSLH